jgi:hypothetical protein
LIDTAAPWAGERRERAGDRDAGLADLVVDPRGRADRVGVAGVGRELHAGHEQQLGVAGLGVGEELELGQRVVVADLDEVEAAAAGEPGDLVERRGGVAALERVDVEVAGVPARAAAEVDAADVRRRAPAARGGSGRRAG